MMVCSDQISFRELGSLLISSHAVQVILFLAPLAFNQVLEEDGRTNRLVNMHCPDLLSADEF